MILKIRQYLRVSVLATYTSHRNVDANRLDKYHVVQIPILAQLNNS